MQREIHMTTEEIDRLIAGYTDDQLIANYRYEIGKTELKQTGWAQQLLAEIRRRGLLEHLEEHERGD